MSWNLALGRYFQLAPAALKEVSRGVIRCPRGCLLAHVGNLDSTRLAVVFVHAENKLKTAGGVNATQPVEESSYSLEELRALPLDEALDLLRAGELTYRALEGLYKQHRNERRIAYVALKEDLAEGSRDAFARCSHWSGKLPLSILNVSQKVTGITALT